MLLENSNGQYMLTKLEKMHNKEAGNVREKPFLSKGSQPDKGSVFPEPPTSPRALTSQLCLTVTLSSHQGVQRNHLLWRG